MHAAPRSPSRGRSRASWRAYGCPEQTISGRVVNDRLVSDSPLVQLRLHGARHAKVRVGRCRGAFVPRAPLTRGFPLPPSRQEGVPGVLSSTTRHTQARRGGASSAGTAMQSAGGIDVGPGYGTARAGAGPLGSRRETFAPRSCPRPAERRAVRAEDGDAPSARPPRGAARPRRRSGRRRRAARRARARRTACAGCVRRRRGRRRTPACDGAEAVLERPTRRTRRAADASGAPLAPVGSTRSSSTDGAAPSPGMSLWPGAWRQRLRSIRGPRAAPPQGGLIGVRRLFHVHGSLADRAPRLPGKPAVQRQGILVRHLTAARPPSAIGRRSSRPPSRTEPVSRCAGPTRPIEQTTALPACRPRRATLPDVRPVPRIRPSPAASGGRAPSPDASFIDAARSQRLNRYDVVTTTSLGSGLPQRLVVVYDVVARPPVERGSRRGTSGKGTRLRKATGEGRDPLGQVDRVAQLGEARHAEELPFVPQVEARYRAQHDRGPAPGRADRSTRRRDARGRRARGTRRTRCPARRTAGFPAAEERDSQRSRGHGEVRRVVDQIYRPGAGAGLR